MKDIKEILDLIATDAPTAINALTAGKTKDPKQIENLREEFHDIKRNFRDTQIDKVQKDKIIGEGENRKKIPGVRIPIPIQNKIVNTATAFEVGEPVTITPEITESKKNTNKLSDEILRLWKVNRLDHILQKAITLQKSELQCAILFYIKTIDSTNYFNKLLGLNSSKEIKVDLLENKNGRMTPYKDAFGDLKAFIWEFKTKEGQKDISHCWVYTDEFLYKINNEQGGKMQLAQQNGKEKHGFNKIPVVYFEQDKPEWYLSETMIDRLEVAISKLAASNDYAGHPIMMLYGEVNGAPGKDEDGKALRFNMVEDDDGKIKHGDAKFLTHDNAPESVKLELDRLEKFIYSLTSTPDLSLENLKSIGDISAKAIKLLFIDAVIKAKMNEGENRTAIERMINVLISGIITTTSTGQKADAKKTFFDIQFNSILPDDLKESVDTYASAVNAGIMSIRTAVESLDMTGDAEKELTEIRTDQASKQPAKDPDNNPDPEPQPDPQLAE